MAFHQKWIRPDNGTVFVVGDTTMAEITDILEDHLGRWRTPRSAKPVKNIASVDLPEKQRVILIDRPGSPQSVILAGHVAPPTGVANNIAIDAMNDVLGGSFTARVNMNLREDKGWSYGARTILIDAQGQRPFIVLAPVQTDQTAPSMAEIRKELTDYLTRRPAEQDELTRVVLNNTRSLPGQFETSGAVRGSLQSSKRYGRPYDYPESLTQAYRSLTLAQVNDAAKQVIKPDAMVWVIVGDRTKIEGPVRDLGFADIEIMDVSGNIVD